MLYTLTLCVYIVGTFLRLPAVTTGRLMKMATVKFALSLLLLWLAGAALAVHKEFLVVEDTVLDKDGTVVAATHHSSCEYNHKKNIYKLV